MAGLELGARSHRAAVAAAAEHKTTQKNRGNQQRHQSSRDGGSDDWRLLVILLGRAFSKLPWQWKQHDGLVPGLRGLLLHPDENGITGH